jgi:hypothetical protein
MMNWNSIRVLVPAVVFAGLLQGSICAAAPASQPADNHAMTVTDTGDGMARVVTIESPHLFRLGFELASNAGLSRWYDLVNDPAGAVCLTATPSIGRSGADQGALFNQVINPGDLIGHARIAGDFHGDIPRALTVLESGAARAVIACTYHPMFSTVNLSLQFTTTYTIYATGRIGIRNVLTALDNQQITEWRNSTITLGDPSYREHLDAGTGTLSPDGKQFHVPGRRWKTNQWTGYQIEQDPWIVYAITGNTADALTIGPKINGSKDLADGDFSISSQRTHFGWRRETNPKRWDEPARYFFEYWDPTTPEPNAHWTRASILLIPQPGNPHQGSGANTHEWPGTKRFYMVEGPFALAKGESVTQVYAMQLGAQNSTILPAIESDAVAAPLADAYQHPPAIQGFAFDAGEACYVASAASPEHIFDLPAATPILCKPAIRIPASGATLEIIRGNKPLIDGQDFLLQKNAASWVILLLKDLPPGTHLLFRQTR